MTMSAEKAVSDEGLTSLVSRLVDEARDYGRAEMAYVQALASDRASGVAKGSALLAGAAAIGLAALVTLLVGLVLTLVPYVGTLGATLLVVGASLLVAALIARTGLAKVRTVFAGPGDAA